MFNCWSRHSKSKLNTGELSQYGEFPVKSPVSLVIFSIFPPRFTESRVISRVYFGYRCCCCCCYCLISLLMLFLLFLLIFPNVLCLAYRCGVHITHRISLWLSICKSMWIEYINIESTEATAMLSSPPINLSFAHLISYRINQYINMFWLNECGG